MIERISPPIYSRRNSQFDSKGNLTKLGILRKYLGMVGEIYSITKDYENPWSDVPISIAMVYLSTGEMKTFGVMSGEEGLEIGDNVEVVVGKSVHSNWKNDKGLIQYVPKVRRLIKDSIRI